MEFQQFVALFQLRGFLSPQTLLTWLIVHDASFHGLNFGGVCLLEIHRILRSGSFWVLSGPPVNYENKWKGWNTNIEEQRSNYEKLKELLTSMCFKLYSKKDYIAVWQKSLDDSCYKKLDTSDSYPPKCDDGTEPDSAWYTPIRTFFVVPDEKLKKLNLKFLPKWPERLHAAPQRAVKYK